MTWIFSAGGSDRAATPGIALDIVDLDNGRLAQAFVAENTHTVTDYDEFKRIMAGPRGFIEAPWCGDEENEERCVRTT